MANEGICLDALDVFSANKNASLARIVNCGDTVRQIWLYDFKTQHIIQRSSGNCLTAVPNIETAAPHDMAAEWNNAVQRTNNMPNGKNEESKFNVNSAPCTANALQKWMLLPFQWK